MIFISYRRKDTEAEVTNLHRRLLEKYGRENVFVDFNDIPAGKIWPNHLQKKLQESRILLAVIGESWGTATFESGENAGRLRLDNPGDWVRQEICTAIQQGENEILVLVVLIDEAKLPNTQWGCELDQLQKLQSLPIRNQRDFEGDFSYLCEQLENYLPSLKPMNPRFDDGLEPPRSDNSEFYLREYLEFELRNYATIQLPLISQSGRPVLAPVQEFRIDLPLVVTHERARSEEDGVFLWNGFDLLFIHEQFRNTNTSALMVDRISRFEDIRRDCDIGKRLKQGSRLVVVGDPGCGKSTLLQWITYHYANLWLGGECSKEKTHDHTLPEENWAPILLLCRDWAGQKLPTSFDALIRSHLTGRLFSDDSIPELTLRFERLLDEGKALLLVDGLDEIPNSENRQAFCRLLTSLANRFPKAPMVVTSRVVGFQAVKDELALQFDHLLVSPLDRAAKKAFVELWAEFIGWSAQSSADLIQQVCHRRVTAKLTENIFLLAMVAQIKVLDDKLPGRRVDIYRRTVQLMIRRRRAHAGPPLSFNEVMPHLEYLAYKMRKRGVQRCTETEVESLFQELREIDSEEAVLTSRTCRELLLACVDAIGILNIAGTETDSRGYDRRVIQFFHQSFQEYFAGQAINHGRDGTSEESVISRLRHLLVTIEVREREVEIWGQYKFTEPVFADYWQEAVRMAIADLEPNKSNDALLMLLPQANTPRPEARARAVFALQCLADKPHVSQTSLSAIFDAVVDSLEEEDGFNSTNNTRMNEAIAAVSESSFGSSLADRLIEEYVHGRGLHRQLVGCSFALRFAAKGAVTASNADEVIAKQVPRLHSGSESDRVRTAIGLMNQFFHSDGKLGFLKSTQQDVLVNSLFLAMNQGDAVAVAAMWALFWLTGAKIRTSGNKLHDRESAHPVEKFVLLDSEKARQLETFLQSSDHDAKTLSYGCMVLTREQNLDIVFHQFDWIYSLATIADGNWERRILPKPKPTGRIPSIQWIQALLHGDYPLKDKRPFAVALGSFGVFSPEMVSPLESMFSDPKATMDQRDEALIYIALIGTPEAAKVLVEAADTAPPKEKEDYFYSRGLFGLLLLDDVDILAEQIRKNLPHSDLNAYAYGLAGSNDPRGKLLLKKLAGHREERIQRAVRLAMARPFYK